ncbi:cbb3-type cytochrome c oxidase subunit I [Paenibacillus sp. IB182496]|uniref:Cytochrome c oxidase subunit 1 n=1 Tax=Paenibacillus sabuli TaxID=2772509 RepID=A0A927BYI4_9BACL|nr:cbb3-type cytochrome c oxidase subunit I [Paenibacillus sabuli]MBD2848090.1 cbb3-type cytochrome c oxidase subunit I [Paenibacillus sabuli]
MKLSCEALYAQSDVILAWVLGLPAMAALLLYITKRRKWPLLLEYARTTNHRKIGLMYIGGGLLFLFRGGLDALLIRAQLLLPEWSFWVLQKDKYNGLFTTHGTIMIFFVAMPLLVGLMNVVVPLQIGARDMAFPYLNALSLWLFLGGAALFNVSFLFATPPTAGWTAYAPLALGPNPGQSYYVYSLQISGIGTLLTAINLLTTIVRHRAPGMTWARLPLFTWASLVAAALMLFAFSALSAGLLLMLMDRQFGTDFFTGAGSPIYWQHLFWIFGHPEVYILALPAFGLFSDIIATFAKKPVYGYGAMVLSIILIGFLGLMVWVHHMFTVGLGPIANTFFALSTMAIAVPTGIKVFNWLFTMRGGRLQMTTPMLFALGFIPSFVVGGVTGVMLAVPVADFQFHDSYFVVGHFHYTIVGSTILGIFAGLYYWYPKLTGKQLNERLGKWHFWLFIAGFHMTFLPMHFAGLQGMPRRTYTYSAADGVFGYNAISSAGAFLMGASMLFLVWNVVRTHRHGRPAPADPWDGRTLEWTVGSPPPEQTFEPMPQVQSAEPLWQAKRSGRLMAEARQTRPAPVPARPLTPLVLAGALTAGAMAMIYRWYVPAALCAAVVLAAMLIRSWRDERIDWYAGHVRREADRQTLYADKRAGVWGYLTMDAIVFAVFFVTYVLYTPSAQGPQPGELFEPGSVLLATLLLLPSSATLVLAERGLRRGAPRLMWLGLGATLALALGFAIAEGREFYTYAQQGYTPATSGFLAAYYVLVGLHFAHVLFGAGWLASLMLQRRAGHGPPALLEEKQRIFGLYWHFVDAVWIGIVAIVYVPSLL